nr:MAG TPA: hypothetical protein [Caudoviricetes sp.]
MPCRGTAQSNPIGHRHREYRRDYRIIQESRETMRGLEHGITH